MKLGVPISVDDFIGWTKVENISKDDKGSRNLYIRTISTDSRTIEMGDFFIPIVGEIYNGHDFIVDAIKKGAQGFVLQKDYIEKLNEWKNSVSSEVWEKLIILISKNNLNFLTDLSSAYIRKFDPIVIGITGSAGKTTTKDFITGILACCFNIKYTPRNYNTEIGIAVSVLEIESNTQFFIAELGMRAKGQIRVLSEAVNLDIGAITAIGPSHLEFFESVKEIAMAKAEMADFIAKKGGILFLNNDDEWTEFIINRIGCRFMKFGRNNNVDFNFIEKGVDRFERYSFDFFKGNKKVADIILPVCGFHNIYNACCAAAICSYLGVLPEALKNGIENTQLEANRMQVFEKDGKIIINDCYNASPLSMKRAIDSLKLISLKNKSRSVAVLADMLELGEQTDDLHYELGKYLDERDIDILIAYGKLSEDICNGFKCKTKDSASRLEKREVYYFKDKESLTANLAKIIKKGDTILLKGSRANKLESLIDSI